MLKLLLFVLFTLANNHQLSAGLYPVRSVPWSEPFGPVLSKAQRHVGGDVNVAVEGPNVPQTIGPFSQGVIAGQTVYISGQTGADPDTGRVPSRFEEQAVNVFRNMRRVAEASGGRLDDIVKITVFLVDLNDYETYNNVQRRFLITRPLPARSSVVVRSLPRRDLLIEVEAIMRLQG